MTGFPGNIAPLFRLVIPLSLLLAATPAAHAGGDSGRVAVSTPLPRTELTIPSRKAPPITLRLEVANTVAARARGLMFRKRLAPDAGMLLLWKRPRRVSIWMKNTYVPLDIVFIGPDWRIVRIHRRARPLDTTLIPSKAPVLAVLEIRAGMADRLRLAPGMRLKPAYFAPPRAKQNAAPAKNRRSQ